MWDDEKDALSDREVACIHKFFEQRGYTVDFDELHGTVTLSRLSFTRTIELGSFRLLCQAIHLKGASGGGRMASVGHAFADLLGPGFVRSGAGARR